MSTTTNTWNDNSTTTTGQQKPGQTGYVQQAYDAAASAANTLTGAISSAAEYATGATSAPGAGIVNDTTTHYRNQQPHVGGVGDLGTTSTADVARLPEERANPDPYTKGTTNLSANDPTISDPATIQQQLNARDPPVPYPESGSGVGVPSESQYRNQQPHVGGVNELGTNSTNDVARLPEERVNPDPLASAPGAGTGTYTDTSRKSRTVGDVTQHGHSGGHTGSNQDVDHGLGMPHREDRSTGNVDQGGIKGATDLKNDAYTRKQPGQEQGVPDTGAFDQSSGAGAGDDDDQEEDGSGKPSKKDKLKGNFMIAKGKLTRDQEVVEQGKALKSTGNTVNQ